MLTNHDTWEAEIEQAHRLLIGGDEAAFRKHMAELGFDDAEIERHVQLEQAVGEKR